MPRIAKDQVAPHQLYGMTKVDNNLTMGMRIRKRFRPGDTVKVHNITSTAIQWQWLDEQDETYTIEDETNIKITNREVPGLWELGPGETDVLPGACAYLFIEALYKQVCVMKTGIVLHPLDEREIRNFSLDDPERQEQFIDAVFVGKLTPTMMQAAAISQLGPEAGPKVLEQLPALSTEDSEYQGRQASERRIVNAPRAATGQPHQELSDLGSEFTEPLGGRATGGLPADRQAPTATDEGDKEDGGDTVANPPVPTAPPAPTTPPDEETKEPEKPAVQQSQQKPSDKPVTPKPNASKPAPTPAK